MTMSRWVGLHTCRDCDSHRLDRLSPKALTGLLDVTGLSDGQDGSEDLSDDDEEEGDASNDYGSADSGEDF